MLVLKELRSTNDEKTVVNTTLLAVADSGCTSPGGCRSTTTGANSGGSYNPHISGYGSDNKGQWWWERQGQGQARSELWSATRWCYWRLVPAGCYWRPVPAGRPVQAHGSMDLLQPMGSTGPQQLASMCPRRASSCSHGLRACAAPHDLWTALGLPVGSYVEPGWPRRHPQLAHCPRLASLCVGLRHLLPHELLGWYTPLPPSFFSFLHYRWQWSNSSYFMSWRVYPLNTSVKFSAS
jgi:hypothetical protein